MAEKKTTTEVAVASRALAAISPVLDIKPVNLKSELYVEPGIGAATEILTSFSSAIIPLQLGVTRIPAELLRLIEVQAREAENLAPLTVAENIQVLRQLKNELGGAVKADGSNLLDSLTYEAVCTYPENIAKVIKALKYYVEQMEGFKKQYGADKFYLAKAADAKTKIDSAAIQTIMLDTVGSFNTLAAGMNGYYMLAAVNIVAKIASLLNDEKLQISGCSSKQAVLNKLDFKITPLHNSANATLVEFFKLLESVGQDLDNAQCMTILDNSTKLKHAIELLETAGKK